MRMVLRDRSRGGLLRRSHEGPRLDGCGNEWASVHGARRRTRLPDRRRRELRRRRRGCGRRGLGSLPVRRTRCATTSARATACLFEPRTTLGRDEWIVEGSGRVRREGALVAIDAVWPSGIEACTRAVSWMLHLHRVDVAAAEIAGVTDARGVERGQPDRDDHHHARDSRHRAGREPPGPPRMHGCDEHDKDLACMPRACQATAQRVHLARRSKSTTRRQTLHAEHLHLDQDPAPVVTDATVLQVANPWSTVLGW